MELIQREFKSDLGLGEHQVSEEEERIEHAVGIAVLAYLLLQYALRLRMIMNQAEHRVKVKLTKRRKAAS